MRCFSAMQSAKFPKIFTIEWKTANHSKAKTMSLLSYSWLALKKQCITWPISTSEITTLCCNYEGKKHFANKKSFLEAAACGYGATFAFTTSHKLSVEKERQKRKFRPSSFFFVCLALIKKKGSSKIAFLPSPTNVWFFMGTYIHFTIFQKLFWLGWKNKGVGGAPAALHSMPKKQRFLSFIWCYASIHFSHVLNYERCHVFIKAF